MLRRGKYDGFNDQHFTEKLVEVEGMEVTRETVDAYCAGQESPRLASAVHPSTDRGESGGPKLAR